MSAFKKNRPNHRAIIDLLHNQIDALRLLWFFDKTKVKLEQIKEETNERFRRLTGVKQSTFDVLVVVLEKAELLLKSQGGKPNKLSIENRLLMTLEYLREYRTYFHISLSYGISESTCYRNIRWVEDTFGKLRDLNIPVAS